MKILKPYFVIFAGIAFASGLASCSNDDKEPLIPEEPVKPPSSTVPLTQFEVLLGNQTTTGSTSSRANMQGINEPKTAFASTDYFTFSYNNTTQASQEAYAYTADGKTWTVHEKKDPNSSLKTIQLDIKSPVLNASYLPKSDIETDKDGIVFNKETGVVGCYDALFATAEVTVSGNNKAIAKVPFKHVNHLLNFYITGTINESIIDHLKLNITYTDASNKEQNAVLETSSRSSYADINGTAHTVIQAIVPRGATVKSIKAIKHGNASEINATGMKDISCPGGKSHLVTLNVNDATMWAQVGSLIDDWAFGGELNPDGSPVGDIFISTEAELQTFAGAVNLNPSATDAKINGVLAYTAHVVQTANITLSNNVKWYPIGGRLYKDNKGDDQVTYFAGTYNGNGYTISGIRVTESSAMSSGAALYGGFFGRVQSPAEGYTILTNIKLINVDIQLTGSFYQSYAGALAGQTYANRGENHIIISQCSAQGTISATNTDGIVAAGGLVGETYRTHITGCSSDVSVTANASRSSHTGGIAGYALSSSIASSYALKDVIGKSTNESAYAGGITGSLLEQNEFSYILACSSEGNVTSTGNVSNAGGVTGANDGKIAGCYAKGNATATGTNAKAGAIVGNGASGINLCYGVGAVGEGTSALAPRANSIVYNVAPTTGNILSIVSGKAWKDANDKELAEATVSILTTLPINEGGKTTQDAKIRLWVLSAPDVWTTASPASNIYPLPTSSYKGQ